MAFGSCCYLAVVSVTIRMTCFIRSDLEQCEWVKVWEHVDMLSMSKQEVGYLCLYLQSAAEMFDVNVTSIGRRAVCYSKAKVTR